MDSRGFIKRHSCSFTLGHLINSIARPILKSLIHHDEVYGDTDFDPVATALLDTSPMQRLGKIYQLGFAHLVFRSGNHTRLSHVMGTYRAAQKLVDTLRNNYERRYWPNGVVAPEDFLPTGSNESSLTERWEALRYLVAWAALVHDIGHVPFGHTLEDEFTKFYEKHDHYLSPQIPYLWYEIEPGKKSEIRQVFERIPQPAVFASVGIPPQRVWMAVMLICLYKPNGVFEDGFQNIDREKFPFIGVLQSAFENFRKTFHPYMTDIVGNTISADYLDYLRRDSQNLGLDMIRDDRVVNQFWVGRDEQERFRMCIPLADKRGKPRKDVYTGVSELVRQRFRMAQIVYYHKTKVSASSMLAKAFRLLGTPPLMNPKREFVLPENVDSRINEVWQQAEKKRATAARRIVERSSPKALLDPEIGDEALQAMLLTNAWKMFEDSVVRDDKERARMALRAVALLTGITTRNLYKVVITIDMDQLMGFKCHKELSDPGKQAHLKEFLDNYRKEPDETSRVEFAMAEATKNAAPSDAFLIYIPPPKSQAKGIDVCALKDGTVTPFSERNDMDTESSDLSAKYQNLWRVIVLARPDVAEDPMQLSLAFDSLLDEMFDIGDPSDFRAIIDDSAWFTYIARKSRPAAEEYAATLNELRIVPDWVEFTQVDYAREIAMGSEAHACRAILTRLLPNAEKSGIERTYPTDKELQDDVEVEMSRIDALESYAAESGPSVKAVALRNIASRIVGRESEHEPYLFDDSSLS